MNKNKVSIALATYNGSDFIEEQLNSFLKQTVLPYELVVVDDCSTDDTVKRIESFKAIAPFVVKIIKNEKNIGSQSFEGYGQTFSMAAKHCSGDVIFFSDQDDVWFANKIETHLKFYESNENILYIINESRRVNADLTKILEERTNLTNEITNLPLMGCCCSGRKEFIKKFLPVPLNMSHDWWFHVCADLVDGYHICHECLQIYRTHNKQTTKLINKKRISIIGKLKNSIKKSFSNADLEAIKRDQYDTWFCRYKALIKNKEYFNKDKLTKYLGLLQTRFYPFKMRFLIRKKTFHERLSLIIKHFKDVYCYNEKHISRAVKTAARDLICPIFVRSNDSLMLDE